MTIAAQVKQCLASVKGIEAVFAELAAKSEDIESKRVLEESSYTAKMISEDLQKRVGELEREEFQYKGF